MCMQGQVYALDSHFLVIVYKEAFVYKNIEKITLMLVKFSNFFYFVSILLKIIFYILKFISS
jgi:hypothetical protein